MFHQRSQAMARAVWDALGIQPDSCTDLQREIVGAFVFGMLSADGMIALLPQPVVHATAVTLLREEVGYSPDSAARFAEELIRVASDPKYHDTLYAILHRGVDGHAQWRSGNLTDLQANLRNVCEIVRTHAGE
jgi:hypothetical protein